ncbi:hypothetical protein Tco_0981083 [Tanacetum coccineum]
MSASMEAHIAEYAAVPTPPLPVASSPLPLPSPLTTSPTDAGAPLGYRAAGIRMRVVAASPPLSLPSTSPRTDVPEVEMPPLKRVCLTTPAPGCEIGESSAAGAARQPSPTPERTEEFQVRFEEAYDDRAYLRARVNILFRDRPYHRHTALALDIEAVYARIAWTGSEERSASIEAHVRTLEAQVATLIAQTTSLQTQLTTTLGRIATLEARDLEPQDEPAEAGSSLFANMKRAGKDFSGRITPLFDTMMVQPVEEMGEDSDHPTDSTPIPIIDQPSSSSQPKKDKPSKKAQRQEANVPQDEAEHEESVPTPSNNPQPSGEDSMQLTELMVLCTKLQTHVLDLQKAKDAQAKEIAALKKRIQRLERRKKSRPTSLKRLRKVGMS